MTGYKTIAIMAACLAWFAAQQSTASPAPETTDAVVGDTTVVEPAPSPFSTSSSFTSKSAPYKKPGTCCKEVDGNGGCVDISASNYDFYMDPHTPGGSNDWCGVPECGCGELSFCTAGEENCGYTQQTDDDPCLCDSSCFEHDRCCPDYQDVCHQTTPPDRVSTTAPAPSTTTTSTNTVVETGDHTAPTDSSTSTTTTSAVVVPTTTAGPTTTNNGTDNIGEDNSVVVISSVVVVVIVVIVVVVIFTVRHIKQKQAESKPLFAASTSNVGQGVGSADLEQPTPSRAAGYESTRSSKKRGKKKKKKSRDSRTDRDDDDAASVSSTSSKKEKKKSKRTRRSPTRGSKSPKSPKVASSTHAHNDVFASPTHHNFEL